MAYVGFACGILFVLEANMKPLLRLLPLFLIASLAGCGGLSIPGVGSFVDIGPGDVFVAQSVTVEGGESVTWVSKDADSHSVTVDTVSGGPDSNTNHPSGMVSGDTYVWKVPNAPSGTKYYYHCRFHGTAGNGTSFGTGMVGLITVK